MAAAQLPTPSSALTGCTVSCDRTKPSSAQPFVSGPAGTPGRPLTGSGRGEGRRQEQRKETRRSGKQTISPALSPPCHHHSRRHLGPATYRGAGGCGRVAMPHQVGGDRHVPRCGRTQQRRPPRQRPLGRPARVAAPASARAASARLGAQRRAPPPLPSPSRPSRRRAGAGGRAFKEAEDA